MISLNKNLHPVHPIYLASESRLIGIISSKNSSLLHLTSNFLLLTSYFNIFPILPILTFLPRERLPLLVKTLPEVVKTIPKVVKTCQNPTTF